VDFCDSRSELRRALEEGRNRVCRRGCIVDFCSRKRYRTGGDGDGDAWLEDPDVEDRGGRIGGVVQEEFMYGLGGDLGEEVSG
jgi:hypothetical protein